MNISHIINKKIRAYNPKGGLDQTAKFFLSLCSINHVSTKEHSERVALITEATASHLKKDVKAAFFGGLLHDVGKIILPLDLFDGHNIDDEEYSQVKTHAIAGFKALKKLHLFIALCAGFHHNLYKSGYGATSEDFPPGWSPATIKKVLEISTIISIADFIDAYTHRETKIKDSSDQGAESLQGMLYQKYPNDHFIIDIALEENKKYS